MTRIVSVISDEDLNRELAAAFRQFADVTVVRTFTAVPSAEDLLRTVRIRKPDCLFISADDLLSHQAIFSATDDLMPNAQIVAVGRQADAELMQKLMRLGIREYLSQPVTSTRLAEVLDSVRRNLAKHPLSISQNADLYTFLPAKPGVGTSTIALSTSCALAHELGARTLLVDGDLSAGTIRFLLKMGSSSSIIDALTRADGLDEDLWTQMVGRFGKLDVLHAGALEPPPEGCWIAVKRLLSIARSQYQVICADLGSSIDPFTVEWMKESRRIFLVTTPELVAMNLAQNRIRSLTDLGLADKVSLILNRKDRRRGHLSDPEVAELLNLHVSYSIKNGYDAVQASILDGVPLTSDSDIGQSILNLAQSLVNDSLPRNSVPSMHRKFLEFFHVPRVAEDETAWHG